MKRKIIITFVLLFSLYILSGCAGNSVTRVWNENPSDPEQVYGAVALSGFDPTDLEVVTGIQIPLSGHWIGDGMGVYTVVEINGKETSKLLKRSLWTVAVISEGLVEYYPAVINRFGTMLTVIGTGKDKGYFEGKSIYILSGSRKFAYILGKQIIPIKVDDIISDNKKKEELLKNHPSIIRKEIMINLSVKTEQGKRFFENLKKQFSNPVIIDGHEVLTSADTETIKSATGMLNHSTVAQRIVAAFDARISLQSAVLPWYEAARLMLVIGIAAFDETLQGNFLEAKVTGYQAGEVLGIYLDACQKELDGALDENIYLKRLLRK